MLVVCKLFKYTHISFYGDFAINPHLDSVWNVGFLVSSIDTEQKHNLEYVHVREKQKKMWNKMFTSIFLLR